jgi:flagellar protein FlaG
MINEAVNGGVQSAGQARGLVPTQTPAPVAAQGQVQRQAPVAEQQPMQPGSQPTDPEPAELAAVVSRLNDYVQNIQRTLSFSVSEDTGRTVIKVYDSETDELIRQIPPEDTIKLAAAIEEQVSSLLFKGQA